MMITKRLSKCTSRYLVSSQNIYWKSTYISMKTCTMLKIIEIIEKWCITACRKAKLENILRVLVIYLLSKWSMDCTLNLIVIYTEQLYIFLNNRLFSRCFFVDLVLVFVWIAIPTHRYILEEALNLFVFRPNVPFTETWSWSVSVYFPTTVSDFCIGHYCIYYFIIIILVFHFKLFVLMSVLEA